MITSLKFNSKNRKLLISIDEPPVVDICNEMFTANNIAEMFIPEIFMLWDEMNQKVQSQNTKSIIEISDVYYKFFDQAIHHSFDSSSRFYIVFHHNPCLYPYFYNMHRVFDIGFDNILKPFLNEKLKPNYELEWAQRNTIRNIYINKNELITLYERKEYKLMIYRIAGSSIKFLNEIPGNV